MLPSRALALAAIGLAPFGLTACMQESYWPSPGPGVPASMPTPSTPPEQVVTSDPAPPPISGGTLIVTADGLAFAADPDRDRIWIVRPPSGVNAGEVLHTVALEPGDEPGRAVEAPDGRVHVALRGAGAVAIVDPAAGTVVERRAVCAGPRGVAYDPTLDAIHVACARGELVTYPAAGGDEIRRLQLDEDLRDVVVDGSRLLVTRFRSAEMLALDATGAITARLSPPDDLCQPNVAWRMVALPGGGAAMVHQRSQVTPIDTSQPTAYNTFSHDCNGMLVSSRVAILPPEGAADAPALMPLLHDPYTIVDTFAQTVVDVAVSPDRSRYALVSASVGWIGELRVQQPGGDPQTSLQVTVHDFGCWVADGAFSCQPTAAAYTAEGELLVFSREPPRLLKASADDSSPWPDVALPGPNRRDTGHDLFHQAPQSGSVACASCHPEGGEDGHVWMFGTEPRRTQTLQGGVLQTAPLHWDGSLRDLASLSELVFTGRMGGEELGPKRLEALGRWLDAIPAPPARASADAEAVARGEALFLDPTVGCAGCHSGPQLTNNTTVPVGTGLALQVPRLVGIGARAPYMHDGCAATLRDRFGPCGGGDDHGVTSHLDEAQIQDLVAYLESL